MKNFKDLTLTDDFMFSKVMRKKDICKEFLELILDKKIEKIEYIEAEKTLNIDYDKRGVRLDVYLQDETTVYNIEMQTSNFANIPKRSRFYQSVMDVSSLGKAQDFDDLKESYVIFVCTKDLFGYNEPIYDFVTYDKKHGIIYGDEAHTVIVNANAEISNETKMGKFINYLKHNEVSDDFTSSIDDTINEIKLDGKMRGEYMVLEAKLMDAKREGREEGREEGIIMTYVNQIRAIKKKEKISIDEALIKLYIPEEYWDKVKRELLNKWFIFE
ncbi:Rpn family recombination-promoting nuclease/putative transposase [Lachnospira sp.]|uniref:Rpn family recombination-promoting nuclease/putative transposase n=1 Tax=Lachnospira sp. TaxID=2049031 RepID=UPI00257C1F2C|nr:Rpn family recombination-promoting nuclease/putative transposase [Lachnospira sp.]